MSSKALFLDRDGVINTEKNYVYKIEDFQFIDGIFDTCQIFQNKGYIIVIITNQAGIARGLYSEDDYSKLTNWMIEQFQKQGIKIAGVYHCPHHPEFSAECNCRKPYPGMILQAQQELEIDLSQSILVGDKISDIQAGIAAGIPKNYLIRTGHLISENEPYEPKINTLKELLHG